MRNPKSRRWQFPGIPDLRARPRPRFLRGCVRRFPARKHTESAWIAFTFAARPRSGVEKYRWIRYPVGQVAVASALILSSLCYRRSKYILLLDRDRVYAIPWNSRQFRAILFPLRRPRSKEGDFIVVWKFILPLLMSRLLIRLEAENSLYERSINTILIQDRNAFFMTKIIFRISVISM